MYDIEILKVLQTAALDAVAASTMPALPVKPYGRTWVVPNDQKWLELVFIPNNREDYWGDEKNYTGMFRLILHWPNDDAGVYAPGAVITSIASYFAKDRPLQNVRIYDNPNSMGVLEEGSELLFPISIRYQCFRP